MSKRRKPKDYLTYGAALNGPLTIHHIDGTSTTQPADTRATLHKIIRKGKNVPPSNEESRKPDNG